jgi:alpha-amylase
MEMGDRFTGKTFVDITGNRQDTIQAGEHGKVLFRVNGASVSVWITQEAASLINSQFNQ